LYNNKSNNPKFWLVKLGSQFMKKKLITTAVLAGIAGTTQAVNVNNDGLGQVLIYPYYSVQGGVEIAGVTGNLDTLLSVYNTTNNVKAVKVRFLDGQNSREVLDFNLYLSPFDVWTASISREGEGGILRTTDNSCTVPDIPDGGVEFRNLAFSSDEGDTSLARTREGHIEIIEMATIVDVGSFRPATWATHGADGVPAACDQLVDAWRPRRSRDLKKNKNASQSRDLKRIEMLVRVQV
jgi:hypothetical protein